MTSDNSENKNTTKKRKIQEKAPIELSSKSRKKTNKKRVKYKRQKEKQKYLAQRCKNE